MSYAMTHLIIANEFADEMKIENKEIFLAATISPDAVHARLDFSPKLKADAHYLQPEEKWGHVYTEESMIIWYDRLRDFYNMKSKLVKNELERDFLLGYTLHILVDIFNCKLLYSPNLIKYDFDVDAMRAEYRRQCILQDNYLYQNYPDSPKLMKAITEGSQAVTDRMLSELMLSEYISAKNVCDNVNYAVKNFSNAPMANLTGLSMVSVEASEYYLATVKNEAERMLYSFPPVMRSFRMD